MDKIIGIYFDFFGTLIDSVRAYYKVWSRILNRLGSDVVLSNTLINKGLQKQMEEINRLQYAYGRSYMNLTNDERNNLNGIMLDTIGLKREGSSKIISEEFQENFFNYFSLNSGCKETLEQIKRKNLKIGLLTNGDRMKVHSKLKELGIFDFFDIFIHSQDYGYNKDDIEVYQTAVELMQTTNPKKIIHVGDDLKMDIEMAKRIGMIPVLLDQNHKYSFDNIMVIHELPEILEFLAKY
ncbi:Phosphoglycolate phosphatase [Candidatus Lokiarchaeum ossiferum]|uniref:Phosphoglycolate phosphatase n=1 Tax=Candidatus Lokiarchaeum ossiferum TaxID=2951803 RepID=A0ABY6HKD6_9ARCH|nr:Phosphoglycolate phosphatase [Candidatus Lokiarchaeum sp. B-35]